MKIIWHENKNFSFVRCRQSVYLWLRTRIRVRMYFDQFIQHIHWCKHSYFQSKGLISLSRRRKFIIGENKNVSTLWAAIQGRIGVGGATFWSSLPLIKKMQKYKKNPKKQNQKQKTTTTKNKKPNKQKTGFLIRAQVVRPTCLQMQKNAPFKSPILPNVSMNAFRVSWYG